ncbi:hypothetical protein RJT34_12306 [Clitoria ternatea]|uniref:C3H1-type domain-containing protein n=1 Tax=Clitoria ternatea TaxID=43366 RepID=A0AAN9PL89_CLITE
MDHHHHHFLHHHHDHRTRYASLPTQSHHHHHHHNHHLPPPPPPPAPPPPHPPISYRTIHTPPPPQPYNNPPPPPPPQPQQFPFNPSNNHRPLEEDRPLSTHHHHHPYDLLPRRSFSDFDRREPPWNPSPRSLLEDQNFVDFDRELHHSQSHNHHHYHHHHQNHRPLPPPPQFENLRYDDGGVRLRTDRLDPYEQNPREGFALGRDSDYHRNGTTVASVPSQGDVEPESSGYGRVYSMECDAEVASRGGRVESKRWLMSDRKGSRELLDSPSSSSFELVNGNDKYYGSETVRYSNNYRSNSNRECGHEFTRTPPKKQVQKKSALLRIQTVKPNHRNRDVEQLRYPGYAPECGSGFFRGNKEPQQHGVKGEERVRSPVELDISFESNSLVAKAIVAPSSVATVPDLNVALVSDSDLGSVEKTRKVIVSDSDCSGSQPVKLSSIVVNLNSSPCKPNGSFSLGKGVQKNASDESSWLCPGEGIDSSRKQKVLNSADVANVSSDKSSPRVFKKKRIVKKVVKKAAVKLGNRRPESMKAESVVLSLPIASGPEKIETNLEEKNAAVDEVSEPDCLHSLPREGDVLNEDKEGGLSLLNLGPDFRSQECNSEKDSHIRKVSRFESDGNISKSPSFASNSEYKKSDIDCLDANNSAHNFISLPYISKVSKSLNESTVSEINHLDYGNNQLCQKEMSLSPDKNANVGSPQSWNVVDVGGDSGMVTFPSSAETSIQDGLDCLQHTSALKHHSDNGISNLDDSISVHGCCIMNDARKQVSPSDVIISPESCETKFPLPNSDISVRYVEGDTNRMNKRKAETHLNVVSSKMESLSPDPVNPVSLANDVDRGSSLLLKDACLSEVLDQSVQSLDFNSKANLDGVTALPGKEEVLEAQFYVGNNKNDTNPVSPVSKRKKVIAIHPNINQCQYEFNDAIGATTSSTEVPMNLCDVQEQQKKVALSSMGIGIPSSAQSMPYLEENTILSDNTLAEGSLVSTDANRETMSSEHLELQHSDIVSNSPCEDLAFPNVQFSLLESEQKENITPIVPTSITQNDILAIENILGEKTDLQGVEENYQYRDFLQRSPMADVQSNSLNMKDDLLGRQNLVSCPANIDGIATSNSKDELIADVPDALSGMSTQRMTSEVIDRRTLAFTEIHDETICEDEENPENISVVEHGSELNTSSMQQTKKIMESDHPVGGSNLIKRKIMSGASQAYSKVTSQGLNSYHSELSVSKNQSGGVILKKFPRHSFTFTKPKTKTSTSTHVSKPRTWHRTGNNPSTSVTRIKPSVGTVPPKRPVLEKKGNFQNTSYIRKGNSLVRKPTPVSGLHQISSVNQSSLGLEEIPKNIKSESRADVTEPMYLSTGATNVSQQRKRTPSPPIDNKSEENISSPLVEPPSSGCCENASDPRKLIETNNNAPNSSEDVLKHYETPENQTGPSNNGEIQVESNDGNIFSLNTKRIVYIKPKTNQLVATSNSCDVSVSIDDKGQTAFSDGYYKRSKNQLVRTSFESHINQTVAMPNNTANSDGQGTSKVPCNKRFSKRRSHKVARSSCKTSRASLVWTLRSKNLSENERDSWHYQKVLPQFFPWKRAAFLRSFIHNSASSFNSSSLYTISKKLLLLRKRDTVYTRSTHGFSLWKSKVLGVGGSSLKWSKSIEKNSKQANEEATLAVAAVERKKREQKNAVCIGSQSKRERIFRIGSVRYRMDPSRRTLQRISDHETPSASTCSGLVAKRAYIPRRLVIGNDEYVRIGNGNQLVRDPKKRTRKLANEKVRWSLHTARQRLARKQKYCQFFTRFGKCNKEGGKCPYIHDPSKIAVCTKFLNGLCSTPNCKLTHQVIPERMPDCSYFLQGLCSNRNCPYRHVNVNPKASVCEEFLKGYCADGNECRKKHSYVCPSFEATGTCTQGSKCKLHHPKTQSKGKKRKRSRDQNKSRGRYFGSIAADVSEPGMTLAPKRCRLNDDHEEELSDYMSLDVDEEVGETVDESFEQAALCDNDSLDLQLVGFDELIKPLLLMKRNFTLQPSQPSSLQA